MAAVLHLGNLQFGVVKKAMEEDSSEVANQDVLELACKLLGVDKGIANTNLISKNIGNRSTIMVAYSVEKAQEARQCEAVATARAAAAGGNKKRGAPFGGGAGEHAGGAEGFGGFGGGFGGGAEAPKKKRKQLGPKKKKGD